MNSLSVAVSGDGHTKAVEPAVLIAEDDENDVFLLRRVAAKASLSIPLVFVRDGQEAIEYLKIASTTGSFPQLVLLDLKMPKYGGLEVLQWIREQPSLKRLVVIIFTASELEADINRAYDLRANSYLLKPADPDDLVTLLDQIQSYWLQANRFPELRNT
jgi:CheY-like chemotaxis protein